MVRRITASSSSRLLFPALCLASCAMLAHGQPARQRSTSGPEFVAAHAIPLTAAPTSFAAGDLNGDGRQDLVVTSRGSGSVVVMLGDGKGGFASSREFAAGTKPENALLADLDGSGRLDLVVTDADAGTIEILRGKGDGTFEKPQSFKAIADPSSLVAGNFGGKGKLDLAVASQTAIAVLLNDGEGHFRVASELALAHSLRALAAADLRAIGHDDLVAANGDGTLTVFQADETGAFRAIASPQVAHGALAAIAAGDFNRDGRADLAVAQASSNTVTVLLGRGDSSFEPGVAYAVGNNPASLLVADLRGDGHNDLIVANAGANTFSVLAGDGEGAFKPAADFVAGNSPLAIASGDFNGDGHADLAILNAGDRTISIPLGLGDGTFHAAPSYRTGLEQKAIATGDLTGHGLADLVVSNFCGKDAACKGGGTATVLLAGKNGAYTRGETLELGSGPVAVALADMNGDKKLDLIAVNRNDKTLMVFPGRGQGSFGRAQIYSLAASPRAVFAGDFNGDGRPDLAIAADCGRSACSDPGSVDIWLGKPGGKLELAASYTVGYSPSSIAAGDLRGSGHLDLLVANACGNDSSCRSHGTATLLKGDGKGKFTEGSEIELGSAPSSIAIGNLSGKGLDLVVAERGSDRIAVLHGDGKGGFGDAVNYKAGSEPAALAIADFDGDGRLDVAVANFKDSTVSVLTGNAKGTLNAAVSYAVGTGPESIVSLTGGKNGSSGLVTANGNTGSKPMGADISLLRVHPDMLPAPTVTVSTNPATNSTVNQSVVLTAAVQGTAPNAPSDTVTFTSVITSSIVCAEATDLPANVVPFATTDNTTGLSTATCTTTSLEAGSDTITAAYSGDTNYSPNSNTVGLTVAAAASNTTVGSSSSGTPPTSTFGQQVIFTAKVTPINDAVGLSSAGTVTFQDNGALLATCVLSAFDPATGVETCTTSSLQPGSHPIKAIYGSDTNYTTSFGTVTQNVLDTTTTMLTFTASPTVDEPLTLTATITPTHSGGPTMGGTVTLTGAPAGCSGALPVTFAGGVGTAQCNATLASLTATTFNVTATYSGDNTNYAGSASNSTPVPVAQAPTKAAVTLQTGNAPSTVDDSVTFLATILPNVTPTVSAANTLAFKPANVSFMYGTNTIPNCGSQPIAFSRATGAATATCTTAALPAGAQAITVVYLGDTNYMGITSPQFTQNVNAANTITTVAAPSPATGTVDTQVMFTATVQPVSKNAVTVPFTTTGATPDTVSFYDSANSGNVLANCGDQPITAGGSASCVVNGLPLGTHKITAIFNNNGSDTSYNSSPRSSSVSYSPTMSNVKAVLTAIPASPSIVDQSVTFTETIQAVNGSNAVVAAYVQIGGSVTFTDSVSGNTICNAVPVVYTAPSGANLGQATAQCPVVGLAEGMHTITATYTGDGNYNAPAASQTDPYTVNSAPTVSALAITSAASSYGVDASIQFTATVSWGGTGGTPVATPVPANGIPIAGTVNFTLTPAGQISPVTILCSGQGVSFGSGDATAQCNATTPLQVGSYSVLATFLPETGNASYKGSTSNAVPLNIGQSALSSFTLSSVATPSNASANTSNVNDSVAFTATLVPPSGGSAPNGKVSFLVDGAPISSNCTGMTTTFNSTTKQSTATCSTTSLTAAVLPPHTITANYKGDSNYSSTSTTLQQTVNPASTSVSVKSSSPNSTVNQSIQLTATVSTTETVSEAFKGTISFLDFGPSLSNTPIPVAGCTIAQALPTATCTTSALTKGTHLIEATYQSDPNYSNSTSSAITQAVNNATLGLALSASPASTTVNTPVTFTATITATHGGTPLLGSVEFTSVKLPGSPANALDISKSCATVAPVFESTSGGTDTYTATCADGSLVAGTYQITAKYNNDKNFQTAPNSINFRVSPAVATLAAASSAGSSTINQPVTFTGTVTTPTGSVLPSGAINFEEDGKLIVPVTPNVGNYVNCSSIKVNADVAVVSGQVIDTGVATCTPRVLKFTPDNTSHTITVSYSGDPNFVVQTAAIPIGQTVTAFTPNLALSTSTTAPKAGQDVQFIATLTTNPGDIPLNGTVEFESVKQLPGGTTTTQEIANCSVVRPLQPQGTKNNAGTWTATCSDSALTVGSYTIVANYQNDTNGFNPTSGTSQLLTVSKATTTTSLTLSEGTVVSSVGNGNNKNVNDKVTFTASVAPATGPPFLSGTVEFTSTPQGSNQPIPIAGCTAVKLTRMNLNGTVQAIATCTPSPLVVPVTGGIQAGSNTIQAAYNINGNGDPNFSSSDASSILTVQDFGLSLAGVTTQAGTKVAPPVTQGYTSANDLFTPSSVTVTPVSYGLFSTTSGKPTLLSCNVTPGGSSSPLCKPDQSSIDISSSNASSAQTPVGVVLDATHANAGSYTATLKAKDPESGLVRTATFVFAVRSLSSTALTIESGATTGNVGTVKFVLPTAVTIASLSCPSVTGTGISQAGGIPPKDIGIGCVISQGAITYAASGTGQVATAKIPILTNLSSSGSASLAGHTTILVGGALGIPLFGLIGLLRGRRSRSAIFRMLALAALCVAGFQVLGCGGSFKPPTSSSGTTPPGNYYIEVQATDGAGNTYQAVLKVVVTL